MLTFRVDFGVPEPGWTRAHGQDIDFWCRTHTNLMPIICDKSRIVYLVNSTYYSRNFFAWDLGRSQNYRGGGPISEVPKNSVKMGLGRSTLNKLAKNNL